MASTIWQKQFLNCRLNGIKYLLIMTSLIISLYLFVAHAPVLGETDIGLVVEFQDGLFVCQAEDISLKNVLDELLKTCQIEISGLETREDESVSFNFKGNIEQGIKQLMMHLGENNFFFKFSDTKLIQVVLTETEDIKPSTPFKLVVEEEQPTVAVVHDIAEGSQAEKIGLIRTDIIQEYDGIPIRTANQLKAEVEKRMDKEKVKIIVKRDNESIPFELKGGIIGVRVKTSLIGSDESDDWGDESDDWGDEE